MDDDRAAVADRQAPGVYYEVVDASASTISGVRTDVAGFVGIAARGPIDVPVPVESWRQFQAYFGGFTGAGYLAYAVRAFFENGGRRCWVVRVASRLPDGGAASASVTVRHATGTPPVWRIHASSPGAWGNDLSGALAETHRFQTTADPGDLTPARTGVASTSGFVRGTLARLSQPGRAPVYRVVSAVDPVTRRLFWVHDRAELRLPYDRPLAGLDLHAPIAVESVEYTLSVLEARIPVAVYEGLSLVPEHPSYGPAVLPMRRPSPRRDVSGQLPTSPPSVAIEELRDAMRPGTLANAQRPVPVGADDVPSSSTLQWAGGADGLTLLTTHDFTGDDESAEDADEVKAAKRRGIRALALIGEVAIVAVPDINIQPVAPPVIGPPPPCVPDACLPGPPAEAAPPRHPPAELPPVFSSEDVYRVQADLVQHCEQMRDRVALLDPPVEATRGDAGGIAAIRAWRGRFESKFAALYFPWVRVVDPLRSARALTRDVPPSGHVAGQFARTDLEIGVHKAPANVPLAWAQDVSVHVSEGMHGALNPLGINVVRALPGRGLRIMGARTVSSDPSWRYVNVRRLVLMIMKAVDLATQWAVFEPNDAFTRAKIRLAITSYLTALWQRGALSGTSAEEGFLVKCDEENNPPEGRDAGHLVAEVAVAPSIPFEFIVLRVWRAGNELEITEAPMGARGR